MRVAGDAMGGDGILEGDLLVIDRSVSPCPGRVVVAVYEGIFVVRRLAQRQGGLWLLASDGATLPIPLQAEGAGGAELWGVVIHAVHHLAGAPSRRR
jgi:DNA polymerase V